MRSHRSSRRGAVRGSDNSFDADHELLFPSVSSLESVALLPLTRQGRIIGSLNMGSTEARRFADHLATDFLHHLAVIAAFCLENAVNRARLVRSGFTDVLTGWHNRRYLQTRLREELARCHRELSPLTCLMIDVDHFKHINDRYGHLAGDEILRQLAQCVDGEVRSSDVSARYGGEEFVILLPATGLAAGRVLAERIRGAVSAELFELRDVTEPLLDHRVDRCRGVPPGARSGRLEGGRRAIDRESGLGPIRGQSERSQQRRRSG